MFDRNSQFSILSSENTIRNATKIRFSSATKLAQTISSGPNNVLQNHKYPLVCDYSDLKCTII